MESIKLKQMLKYNYFLSQWFAGKKHEKVIVGTAFLFLNQVSFLFLALFLFLNKFVPLKLSPEKFTWIVMLVGLIIMYGFQNKVQARVRENNYGKDYNSLSIKQVNKNRMIALFLLVLPFILCFAVAFLFYR